MYFFETWADAVTVSLQNLLEQFSGILMPVLGAIVIFILGWIIATAFGSVTERILKKVIHVDKIFDQLGFMAVLHKSGLDWEFSGLIGWLVKWFFLIAFFLAGVEILGLNEVAQFLREDVLVFIPKVLVAALIILIAAISADFVDKLVTSSTKAAELKFPKIGSLIVRWSVWIFALLIALEQLGVESNFLNILFMGIVAFAALAGGLAFGLGGQGAAKDLLDKTYKDLSK